MHYTFSSFILAHKSNSRWLPSVFKLAASFSCWSKRTVAAEWKTIFTVSNNVFTSGSFKPIRGCEMSPETQTIFRNCCGCLSRITSNIWGRKIIIIFFVIWNLTFLLDSELIPCTVDRWFGLFSDATKCTRNERSNRSEEFSRLALCPGIRFRQSPELLHSHRNLLWSHCDWSLCCCCCLLFACPTQLKWDWCYWMPAALRRTFYKSFLIWLCATFFFSKHRN